MTGDPDTILMVSRLVLAVPLAVGAADRAVRRSGAAGLVNVPTIVLAFGEATAAVGLVAERTAWFAAILAVGCLAVPAVPATGQIARGHPEAGLPVVVRAVSLALPAMVILALGYPDPGPGLLAWLSGLTVGQQLAVVGATIGLAVMSGPRPARREVPDRIAVGTGVALVPLIRPAPELTIGMATFDDFDGVYFTLQALRLYHDLENTELLVVDNYGCAHTRDFVTTWVRGKYVLANDVVGTATAKELVFRHASGSAVLCCDSHVLFEPGVVARLRRFYRDHPGCVDLLQGPLLYDDGAQVSSHFDPVWRDQMWGVWATDARVLDRDAAPFEIPMQGLGVFTCRTEAWLGFHPGFRGFGGEEGYLHEKFRQAGRRCLCLPWLRWMHRFGRPRGTPYPLTVEDKLRNYLLGHAELGLDPAPVLAHFAQYLPPQRITQIAEAVHHPTVGCGDGNHG